jgi:chromosome partitioning protein
MVPAEGLGWPDGPVAGAPGSALPGLPGAGPGRPAEPGLGWPGRRPNGDAAAAVTAAAAPSPFAAGGTGAGTDDRQDGSGERVHAGGGALTEGRTVNGAHPLAESGPARVHQALSAAVSRGTVAGPAAGPAAQEPPLNGVEGVMHGVAHNNSAAGSVVIPEVPQNSHDTPIARAAEAAVGVRGAGDDRLWPRPAHCRIMTIANQKGGVGKTTTAVNLAASLAQHGSRVLVVDLDPQGNASTALDVDHHVGTPSVYNTLVEDRPLADIVRPVEGLPGLYCAPATIDLAGAEIELVPLVAREARLSRAVAAYDSTGLDYIFIDCPPSLGLLTLNALVAAREVLIPIQCEYYALEGLEQLLRTVDLVKSHLNPTLQVSTILLTMYDGRTRLASQVADDVRSHFGEVVLQSIIPRSVRVSEAPSYGQSVITYDPGSSGSIAYVDAARELSARSAKING